MTRLTSLLLLVLLLSAPAFAGLEVGVVAWEDGRHIVIATSLGYTVGDIYYGNLYEGQLVIGKLHSFGFTELWDRNGHQVGRIFVDDYFLTARSAARWLAERL